MIADRDPAGDDRVAVDAYSVAQARIAAVPLTTDDVVEQGAAIPDHASRADADTPVRDAEVASDDGMGITVEMRQQLDAPLDGGSPALKALVDEPVIQAVHTYSEPRGVEHHIYRIGLLTARIKPPRRP